MNVEKELEGLLAFNDDADKLRFEANMLHFDTMDLIAELMKAKNNMSPASLAKELTTSKSYVSQLFSGNKKLNFETLAKLQRIFKTRFTILEKQRKTAVSNVIVLELRDLYKANNNINPFYSVISGRENTNNIKLVLN